MIDAAQMSAPPLLELDPTHMAGTPGIAPGTQTDEERAPFPSATDLLDSPVGTLKTYRDAGRVHWDALPPRRDAGLTHDLPRPGFVKFMQDAVDAVLDASRQASELNESAKLIERKLPASLEEAGVIPQPKVMPTHQPCAGCADKAKQVERRIDALAREINDARSLLVGAIADIERLKAISSIATYPRRTGDSIGD